MTWVYKRSEPRLWTVGFYAPDGTWHPESDHEWPQAAAARVRYLNGGPLEEARPSGFGDDGYARQDAPPGGTMRS